MLNWVYLEFLGNVFCYDMDADGLPIVGRGINLAEVTLIFDLRVDTQTVYVIYTVCYRQDKTRQ